MLITRAVFDKFCLFFSTIFHHLSIDELRESACDCIHEIIMKGMEPIAKQELVESLIGVLEKGSVLPPQQVINIKH